MHIKVVPPSTDSPGDSFVPDTLVRAKELLAEAEHIITGDRQEEYGHPLKNFARIATFWEAYLGTEILPADVAAMMAFVKLSRLSTSLEREDSWVDLAGYAALGGALAHE